MKVRVEINIKDFIPKDKRTVLGYYYGHQKRKDALVAKIEINNEQSPDEMFKTLYHELSHFLIDFAMGPMYLENRTEEQLKREEKFCETVEKAAIKAYSKFRKQEPIGVINDTNKQKHNS